MSQQLGIIVMVDAAAAIKAKSLDGNVYMFDNMKLQGSEGQGTGSLVTALHGTHWLDGSQANELVLNWLPYAVGSVPPTLPKTFTADRSRNSDLQALNDIQELTNRLETTDISSFSSVESVLSELQRISQNIGIRAQLESRVRNITRDLGMIAKKVIDVTGELIVPSSDEAPPEISQVTPILTNITGEAVDKKIMYEAEYGSPDLVTDGWYWSAAVDCSQPGTYAYTMHIELHEQKYVDGQWVLEPIDLTCEAYLKIDRSPKVNGFTGAGVGMLPIY